MDCAHSCRPIGAGSDAARRATFSSIALPSLGQSRRSQGPPLQQAGFPHRTFMTPRGIVQVNEDRSAHLPAVRRECLIYTAAATTLRKEGRGAFIRCRDNVQPLWYRLRPDGMRAIRGGVHELIHWAGVFRIKMSAAWAGPLCNSDSKRLLQESQRNRLQGNHAVLQIMNGLAWSARLCEQKI